MYTYARFASADICSLQQQVKSILSTDIETFRRTINCGNTTGGKPTISITTSGKPIIGNVQRCKNKICPSCADYMYRVKRYEIWRALDYYHSLGYTAYMLTLTQPHNIHTQLAQAITTHHDALSNLRRGRGWQRIKQALAIDASITGHETTYGAQGWHYHTHIILLCGARMDADALGGMDDVILERWIDSYLAACGDEIAHPDWTAGKMRAACAAHITTDFDSSSYLVKTLQPPSIAMIGCAEKTPFQLALEGDKKRYLDFSYSVRGRDLVRFSPGLKRKIGLDNAKPEIKQTLTLSRVMTPKEAAVIRRMDARGVIDYLHLHNMLGGV